MSGLTVRSLCYSLKDVLSHCKGCLVVGCTYCLTVRRGPYRCRLTFRSVF